jgi:hypothetical protein
MVVLGEPPADVVVPVDIARGLEPEPAGDTEPEAAAMAVRVAVRGGSGRHDRITASFVAGSDHEVLLSLPAEIAGDVPRALTVTLVHDGDRLTRVLPARVVPAGSSTVVPFSLYVRHDEQFVLATVTVTAGDMVVAESVLLGDTGSTPDAVVGGSIQLRRR